MAEDTQEVTASTGTVAGDAGTEASSQSTPDVDTEALRDALEAARTEAGLQATITDLKRATGHIPGVLSSLDKLSKEVQQFSATTQEVRALAQRFDTFVNNLPDGLVSERVVASLRPQAGDTSDAVLAKLAELEERLATPQTQQPQQELTPEQAQNIAQWDTATAAVEAYAKRHDIDPAVIAQSVWSAAMQSNLNDPAGAAVEVMKHVDSLVTTKAQQAERADAGKGGTNGSRSTRSGPLTIEQLRRMSLAEVQALPQEEVMAAMAGAG